MIIHYRDRVIIGMSQVLGSRQLLLPHLIPCSNYIDTHIIGD